MLHKAARRPGEGMSKSKSVQPGAWHGGLFQLQAVNEFHSKQSWTLEKVATIERTGTEKLSPDRTIRKGNFLKKG